MIIKIFKEEYRKDKTLSPGAPPPHTPASPGPFLPWDTL